MSKELMSKEAFNELIDGFECVERLTEYGRRNIKYYVQKLQKENKQLKEKYLNAVVDYETTMSEKNELKKQLEEYQKDIKDLDNQNKRAFENMQLNQLKVCNIIKQQKEFIKWLEDSINKLVKEYGNYVYEDYSEEKGKYDSYQEILQKYEEIMNEDDKDE